MPKIVSAAEAVQLIPDNAVIAVNSSSGLNCPDAVLKALGARFETQNQPRAATGQLANEVAEAVAGIELGVVRPQLLGVARDNQILAGIENGVRRECE